MSNGNLVTTIEIKDRQGRVIDTKEVVTYAGLLSRAHQEGLKKVLTELIQAPSKANEMTAICMAEVVTEKGTFRDYGDANPTNVDSMIIPHIIRMAVTRAKARALRDAVNIGVVAIEELGKEFGNGVNNAKAKPAETSNGKHPTDEKQKSPNSPADGRQDSKPNGRTTSNAGTGNAPMSEAQRRYLFRILAEHGVNGDTAHEYLKQTFGVNTLKEVAKAEASELINLLLSDAANLLEGVAA